MIKGPADTAACGRLALGGDVGEANAEEKLQGVPVHLLP